jgi:hypothetical protein
MNIMQKMPDQEYFAADGLSCSFMKQFDRSPAHAMAGIQKTPAMTFGSALHCYALERARFDTDYVIQPDYIKIRKGKAWDAFKAENEGKEIIKPEELNNITEMVKNIPGKYLELIATGETEVAVFWESSIMGDMIQCKGKLDAINDNVLIDLKTTDDASKFAKSVINFAYYRQAAWYLDGVAAVTGRPVDDYTFKFVAMEKTAPYGVIVFDLDKEYLKSGRAKNLATMINYSNWSGQPELYKNIEQTIEKPSWID